MVGKTTLTAAVAAAAGDLALADRTLAESEAALRELGSPWDLALTLAMRGRVRWSLGDVDGGREAAREAVVILAALGDTWTMVQCLSGLAWVAAGRGRRDRAALLRGAADTLRERSGAAVFGEDPSTGPEDTAELAALREQGRHLALDEVAGLVSSDEG